MQLHADAEQNSSQPHYPKGDNETYDKKPVASWVFAFKRVISWEERGWRALNVSFSMHACAGIFVLIDDLKRKSSTLVKRDT